MLAGTAVEYFADDYIELLPGFEVAGGAEFYADVEAGIAEAYRYEYFLRDHLGSNRILFADMDADGTVGADEVLQENHSYAYGLAMRGEWSEAQPSVTQDRKYNGKELTESLGLYDYGARWYDAAAARWTTIDPMAEAMGSWSPYNYTFGNPVNYTDPTGMVPAGLSSADYDYGFAKLVQGDPAGFFSPSSSGGTQGGGGCPDCNLPMATVTADRYGASLTANDPLREYTTLDFADQISSGGGMRDELNPFLDRNEPIDGYSGFDLSFAALGGFGVNFGRICDGTNCNTYFSIFATIGAGANVGIDAGQVNWRSTANQSNSDFSGGFINYDFGAGPFGYSFGGDIVTGNGINPFIDYGRQYTTGGGGVGQGPSVQVPKLRAKLSASAMVKIGYTWVF